MQSKSHKHIRLATSLFQYALSLGFYGIKNQNVVCARNRIVLATVLPRLVYLLSHPYHLANKRHLPFTKSRAPEHWVGGWQAPSRPGVDRPRGHSRSPQ